MDDGRRRYLHGDSVPFAVAEQDAAGLYDLCGGHGRDMARLLFLVPKLGSSRPTPGGSWPWICISFVLGRDQVKRLKQLVVAQIEEGKTESFHCSTIVVSYAYVWPCLVPAQGVDRDKTAHLAFAVDCRGRLSLPLPAGYFGSCVGSCYVEVGSGDTAGGDDDGFLAACEATGRTIERLKEGLFDGAERWLEKMSYVLANRAMSVAGSRKLKVYGVDFGWGRPQKVEMDLHQDHRGREPGGRRSDLCCPRTRALHLGLTSPGLILSLQGMVTAVRCQ